MEDLPLNTTDITFRDDLGHEQTLRCPRCGEGYLHHSTVKVYSRMEDAPETDVTVVHDLGRLTVNRLPSASVSNPSFRRDGVAIRFWCECCGEEHPVELTLSQHKGHTCMSWRLPQ